MQRLYAYRDCRGRIMTTIKRADAETIQIKARRRKIMSTMKKKDAEAM